MDLNIFWTGLLDIINIRECFFWTFIVALISASGPLFYVVTLHFTFVYVLIYQYWYKINEPFDRSVWTGARHTIGLFWDTIGRIWHGYEVIGMKHIPDSENEAALLVVYHGAIAIDVQYLLSRIWLVKHRLFKMVLDRFLFKMPMWNTGLQVCSGFSGGYEKCVKYLKEGHLVTTLPGGTREGLFGDENYPLIWGKRTGFARAALEAKVPIIPIYTQNIREAFRVSHFLQIRCCLEWCRTFYEKTRIPFLPVYGGLPVKLRTIIGEPIPYDPKLTPEELAHKTARSIENLIAKYQTIPGSHISALCERIYPNTKWKNEKRES